MRNRLINELDEFKDAKLYWLDALRGELPKCRLPEDTPTAPAEPMGDVCFKWDARLSAAMFSRCRENHLALFTLLLAALGIVVSRYCNEADVMLAAPVYNPGNRRFNRLLPFRVPVDPDIPFKQHLAAVKNIVEQSYKNEHFPMAELNVDGDDPLACAGVTLVLENIHASESELSDVSFVCRLEEGVISGIAHYPRQRFEEDTIVRVMDCWRHVMATAVAESEKSVRHIDVMDEPERRRLLELFTKKTRGDSAQGPSVTRMFAEVAGRRDNAVAVCSTIDMMNIYDELRPEQIPIEISYRDLNRRANRLACLLRRHGAGPETMVALWLRHPLETVVAILGVLKAGAAYLPLDTGYPTAITDYILKDSAAGIIVTEPDLQQDLPPVAGNRTIIRVDAWAEGLEDSEPPNLASPGDLAYAIYTSGTTGRPKGVLVERRAIANYAQWRLRDYEFSDRDVTLQLLPYSFDGFCSNFYCGLLCGGRLVMIPGDKRLDIGYIVTSIRQWGVTNTSLVPGVFRLLLDGAGDGDLASLRMVVLAGERSEGGLLEKSRRMAPNARLFNEYGPTETTVAATANPDLSATASDVIGGPIDNTSIFIVDERQQLQPMKAPGELCVAGAGLARGYLNQPELTAQRFVRNPYGDGRLYRSGDVAQCLPGGSIRLAGRLDLQVKVRGYRIETAAVQSALNALDQVKNALVTTWNDHNGDAALVGYVVPAGPETPEGFDPALVKNRLAEVLPDYMIPTFIIPLSEIPLTANGKPDRGALPQPGQAVPLKKTAPRNSVEQALAEIWAGILGIEAAAIGIDQSFFDIGGHSLKAAVLESMISKRFQVFLPLARLFETPTIRELGAAIAEQGVSTVGLEADCDNLSLLRDGNGANLFVIHDGSGELEAYLPLCGRLKPSVRCWGVRADRRDSVAPFNVDLEELARRYADILMQTLPDGPFYLAGWSAGGTIAFAVAHRLEACGRQVAMLGLLDAPAPHEGANAQPLTVASEQQWLGSLLPQLNKPLDLERASSVEELWNQTLERISQLGITVEDLAAMIRQRRHLVIPSAALASVETLLRYLNNGRSYVAARDRYTPPDPLRAAVVLLKADRAGDDFKFEWNRYAHQGLQVEEVAGDHFSFLTEPDVERLADVFDRAMERCAAMMALGDTNV